MPIITQTLNINNLRTTSAKSINLHTIRKLVEYSLNNVAAKAMFTLTAFGILLSEVRSVLSPAQRGTGSERVNVMNNLFLYFQTLGAIFPKNNFRRLLPKKTEQMETLSTSQIESNLDYKIHQNS